MKPANPEKASDNTYTYAFKGWKNFSSVCVGNAEYTPEFTSTYIEYSVVFKNYDNSVISSKTYHYGDTIVEPATPNKPADNVYSYTFAGWDKTIQTCNGNTEYKATYTQVYIDYTVEFKDSDGTMLSSNTYHYGDDVVVPTNPTKAADSTYTYSFKAWDKEVINCNGNATYTATYNQTYIEYTIIFKNYDGTELSNDTYHYGDIVVAPSNPTKASDNTYSYTFNGWNSEIVNCNGNATYTATYSQDYINYTIKFVNYDGSEISTITCHYGDAVVEPTTPTKDADNTYTYTFNGWDSDIVNCNGNVTYTATYSQEYINYTVKFVNDDGSEISTATYHYGDEIVEPSAPTKASDGNYTYTFAGWDSEVVNCNGDKTYTATYTSKPIEKGGSGCASTTSGGSSGSALGNGFTASLTVMAGAAIMLMVRRRKDKYNNV